MGDINKIVAHKDYALLRGKIDNEGKESFFGMYYKKEERGDYPLVDILTTEKIRELPFRVEMLHSFDEERFLNWMKEIIKLKW